MANEQQVIKRKVPLGGALSLSDQKLDELSEITDEDLDQATIAWMREAPRWAQNLLLADGE